MIKNILIKIKYDWKTKYFIEGFGYGITSMARGIFYGVTDIVRKPIEGIKQKKI